MRKAGCRPYRVMMVAALFAGLGTLGSGCLTRDVSGVPPTTKINYETDIRTSAIDKIDLLFAIDNSKSMGDKQALFAEAVPDLIKRLLTPKCVNDDGSPAGGDANADGKCASGEPEFQPVHDLHIGIVSSSLGPGGAVGKRSCDPEPRRHVDDKGHLVNRGPSGNPVVDPASNFLTWLPDKNPADLDTYFRDLVVGVQENGCGYEAQLESVYRFLVQPDPYRSIELVDGYARLEGVDNTLLEQRRNFLRPDSLVAIIMLTDENESTVDPLALGGQAWLYEDGTARVKKGTPECTEKHPYDPKCFSCGQRDGKGVPGCGEFLSEQDDELNVRFFHMKERFGVDPRFPIERYTTGFSKPQVPNRANEHPNGHFNYVGSPNCTNPLFAKNLPADDSGGPESLCNLSKGTRTSDLVFFALIGGVPWQLLTTDPQNGNGPFKAALEDSDWQRILGADPLHYDFAGQDKRMNESIKSRGLEGDWETYNKDLQYACTFALPPELQRECPIGDLECDCRVNWEAPLCLGRKQIRGKAYPTISQLAVAKALDKQSVVASLCPRSLEKERPDGSYNPDYGYRPAVQNIVDRLKNGLTQRCVPQPLEEEVDGTVPCLVLALLPAEGDQATACDPAKGQEQPDPVVLRRYRERQRNENDTEGLKHPVCAIRQLKGGELVENSCEKSEGAGWCYVTRAKRPGENCAQSIKFSPAGDPVSGTSVRLQCLEQPPTR